MKALSKLAILCLGLLTPLPTLYAQSTTATTTADLTLNKFEMLTSTLDPLGGTPGTAGKDGPACQTLIDLYLQVRSRQGFNITTTPPGSHCQTASLNIDYLIVNYVRWNGDGADKPVSTWYLLSPSNPRLAHTHFAAYSEVTTVTDSSKIADRIYGSNRVGILLVHRNFAPADIAGTAAPRIDYTVTVTHQKSVQATDLSVLIGILGGGPGISASGPAKPVTEFVLAAAAPIGTVPGLPNTIALAGQAFLRPPAAPAPDAKPDATFSQTYDNEGYARWDISAAIPITGLKDVQYTQVGSIVSAKTVTRANAYALAHFYPVKVDLKGDYPWQPSLVAGLALTGKPLDKPFAGLAIGTKKPFPFQVNVFAGAVFNKVFTSASATDATLLNSHRVTKLLYGIDIPIGQLAKAISGK